DERPANFVPYDDPPVVIGSISPVYPEFAKRNGVQGTVVLEVEVLKDGSVRNIHVKKSVPGGLDEAAIEAIRKVRFQPGKSSGQPVDVLLIIPVEFKLN
ncbi:MAG: energy transducer TonB, partial [Candidatus Cloacimonetes bacterium]|nr:energy transducer TonB [Candidatus Cloacimonadota bacterium]